MDSNSWWTLSGHVAGAVKEAALLKAELVDSAPLSAEARRDVDDMITRSARELSDLDRRAQAMGNAGRVEELQESGEPHRIPAACRRPLRESRPG